MKLKKGDNVIVVAGKDKGTQGRIDKVLPKTEQVVVEGVNVQKRHRRSRGSREQGQIVERAAPIHVSNVMMVDPKQNKPTRIGVRTDEKTGRKVRVAKLSGTDLK